MTSMELNQELFRQLAIVASDENLMRKTIKAIKRIIEKKEEQDTTEMTREQFMARVEQAERGKTLRFDSVEDIDRYVRSL
ncbi:hypothetical protein [Segatella maculosa]|uniref:hypothetical protein n=1 Tax=Segatella maculosa TaxID=439703 RepID=UPI0024934536|nr:hypothetical protein [Segatella maculosa]